MDNYIWFIGFFWEFPEIPPGQCPCHIAGFNTPHFLPFSFPITPTHKTSHAKSTTPPLDPAKSLTASFLLLLLALSLPLNLCVQPLQPLLTSQSSQAFSLLSTFVNADFSTWNPLYPTPAHFAHVPNVSPSVTSSGRTEMGSSCYSFSLHPVICIAITACKYAWILSTGLMCFLH